MSNAAIRALVVDDERLARQGLRAMLQKDPDLEVLECGTGAEAVNLIQTGSIDLVLLDIQMREVDGFAVIERVGVDRMPTTIFTTAFDSHAIRAFGARALDYLLKPISDERLAGALARAKSAIDDLRLRAARDQLLTLLKSGPTSTTRRQVAFSVRSGTKTSFVDADAVDWIESADNYARLWTAGRSHLVRESLQQLAERLRAHGFVRVHRTALVNVARVVEMRSASGRERAVVLRDGTRVPVSRERVRAVQVALRTTTATR